MKGKVGESEVMGAYHLWCFQPSLLKCGAWVIRPEVGRDGVCGFRRHAQNRELPVEPGVAIVIAVVFCPVFS